MRISPFRRLSQEDFPAADSWFTPIFQILNPALNTLSNVLQGNLTFGDNIRSELYSDKFTHNVPKLVAPHVVPGKPLFVAVSYADGWPVVSCTVTKYVTLKSFEVTVLFDAGALPSGPVQMSLLIVG